jgi:hypothetical protein
MMEAGNTSETSVGFYQTTRRNNNNSVNLQQKYRQDPNNKLKEHSTETNTCGSNVFVVRWRYPKGFPQQHHTAWPQKYTQLQKSLLIDKPQSLYFTLNQFSIFHMRF